MTPPPAERTVGLHLDPLGVERAVLLELDAQPIGEKINYLPAAMLPYHEGELPRGDVARPGHRRGDGRGLDAETTADTSGGVGRYPLAFAWPELLRTKELRTVKGWSWRTAGKGEITLSPARALAVAGASACHSSDYKSSPSVGMLIPEGCDSFAQQAILDAFSSLDLRPLLIWRSVAAASLWLNHHTDKLPSITTKRPGDIAGTLLCVYVGIDAVEITRVAIVAHQGDRRHGANMSYLPGRYRRSGDLPTVGWMSTLQAVADAEMSTAEALRADLGRTWNQCWSGDAADGIWAAIRSGTVGPAAKKVLYQRMANLQAGYATTTDFDDGRCRIEQDGPSFKSLHEAIETEVNDLQDSLCGVVLHGALSHLSIEGHALSGLLRKRFKPDLPWFIEQEDEVFAPGAIACQAAIMRRRVDQGLPAWLDTLPIIELVVADASGERKWRRLLQEDDAWVEGGRPWHREDPLRGFEITAGNLELTIPIKHEDFITVRDLTVNFDEAVPESVPVRLEVEMTPAQGLARLRVHPEEVTAVAALDEGVLADWQGMRDTGLDPDDYIKQMPSAYPPTLPRKSNINRWRAAKLEIEHLVAKRQFSESALRSLADTLRQNSQLEGGRTMAERQATAVSSDGSSPFPKTDDEMLASFSQLLMSQIMRRQTSDDSVAAVRVLGYLSTSHDGFAEYLHRRLCNRTACSGRLVVTVYTAAGHCIRSAQMFQTLTHAAIHEYQHGNSIHNQLLLAVERVLQYRPDAAKALDNADSQSLARAAWGVFEHQLSQGNGQYIFRNAASLIGFLLRRRIYDKSFLMPGEQLTEDIRRSFVKAYFLSNRFNHETSESSEMIERFPDLWEECKDRTGRLNAIGGAVDIQAALKQLLDYVDRRGTGELKLIPDK